jgi:hypothetical protein
VRRDQPAHPAAARPDPPGRGLGPGLTPHDSPRSGTHRLRRPDRPTSRSRPDGTCSAATRNTPVKPVTGRPGRQLDQRCSVASQSGSA